MMKCPDCNKEISFPANFCPWCGTLIKRGKKLPFDGISLTFLRADISNFTAMSEEMTPEDVMSFLNKVFDEFQDVIKSYNGEIYQIIGDEVVSIFGIQKETEFVPHMAVFAGEEMFQRLQKINAPTEYHKNISLKIGAEIELSSIYHIQTNIRHSLILTSGFRKAQILQKNAMNNTILVGENLYKATSSFFSYKEIGEFIEDSLSVKAYEYKFKVK